MATVALGFCAIALPVCLWEIARLRWELKTAHAKAGVLQAYVEDMLDRDRPSPALAACIADVHAGADRGPRC